MRKIISCCIFSLFLPLSAFPEITCKLITFDDLKPAGSSLDECWGGIGIDSNQNVYVGISDMYGVGPDDALIFRYNTRTGDRKFLTSLREISDTEGNLGPNEHWSSDESIAKLHTAIRQYNGKMYFASQDYHSLPRGVKDLGTPDSSVHRDGHFYSYDLTTGKFEDMSKNEEYGVSVRFQGIIAMDILEKKNKLVGWTFPLGDILIFDLDKRKTTFYSGVPEYQRANVSRKIIAARNDKVYFSYDMYDNFWLWELNIETGEMKRTDRPNILSNGLINGMVKTSDVSVVYLQTPFGYLHAFHVEEEHLEHLGYCLTDEELEKGYKIWRALGIVLSKDEKKLYSLPYKMKEGVPCGLYEYNLVTGERFKIADFSAELGGGVVTGSGVVDDQGRIYFCYHTADAHGKGHDACLLQIDISDRLEKIPTSN